MKRFFHSLGSFITFADFTLFFDLPKLELQDKINFFHRGVNNHNQEQNINQFLLARVGQSNIPVVILALTLAFLCF